MDDRLVLDEHFLFENFEDQPVSKGKSKKSRKRKLSDCNASDGNIVDLPDDVTKVIEQKEKYIQQLEDQNNKLKAVIKRLCGPQTLGESGNLWKRGALDSMPMAVILYINNELSMTCQRDIEETMISMASNSEKMKEGIDMSQDLKSQPSAVPLRAFAVDTRGKRLHIAKKFTKDGNEPHIYSAIHYYIEFCIDRTGLPLLENNPSVSELWNIPIYEQVFLNVLPAVDDDGKKVFIRQNRTKYCFNCLGDHTVSQCEQPRDLARINLNRHEFMNKFGGSPSSESRYHQGDQERFKGFKAGTISENLREALMICKDELPPYIYKMRTLGYPPGYLKSSNSGLLMYGKGGKIQDNYDGGEEGEIQPNIVKQEVLFPGFNAPLEEGVIDRSIEFGMEPFESFHAEELNKSTHAENYLQTPPLQQISHQRQTLDDMEVDDNFSTLGDNLQSPIEVYTSERVTSSPRVTGIPSKAMQPPLPHYTPEKAPPPPSHSQSESPQGGSSYTSVEIGEMLEKAELKAKKSNLVDTYLAQGCTVATLNEDSSSRKWWDQEPLSSIAGILYQTYTPPPTIQEKLDISDIFKYSANDLDREPWKTDSTSWYDPLYGDLATPTGIYDAIKEILKKKKKRMQAKYFS